MRKPTGRDEGREGKVGPRTYPPEIAAIDMLSLLLFHLNPGQKRGDMQLEHSIPVRHSGVVDPG
jgi:hypothetical protein